MLRVGAADPLLISTTDPLTVTCSPVPVSRTVQLTVPCTPPCGPRSREAVTLDPLGEIVKSPLFDQV